MRARGEVKEIKVFRKIFDLCRGLWLCQHDHGPQLIHVAIGKAIRGLCQCVKVRKIFTLHIQQHIHLVGELAVLQPQADISGICDAPAKERAVDLLPLHGEEQPCDVFCVLRLGF